MPLCYEDDFRVYQFECDPWDRMTPGAILRRVQEVSTMQCESLGINEEMYKRTHSVFLLSRLSLQIYRAPAIEEQIRIETRAYGMRKAVYHRVTSLHAPNGDKLAETDSRWVLVDTETRRIMRRLLPEFVPYFNEEPGAEEHDMHLKKPEGRLVSFGERRAAYSLCDRNGHVNNTRYADLMCDHIPLEQLRAGSPKRMVLNYHAEIPLSGSFELAGAAMGENSFYFIAKQPESKNFEGFVTF